MALTPPRQRAYVIGSLTFVCALLTMKILTKSIAAPDVDDTSLSAIRSFDYEGTSFRACFEQRADIPAGCYVFCDFALDVVTVFNIGMGRGACPKTAVQPMMRCAGKSQDHSACCRQLNVHETMSGDRCVNFCDSRRPVELTLEQMPFIAPCAQVFESIRYCYASNFHSKK